MKNDKGYRLNCLLPKEIGEKLGEAAERTGMTRVGIIQQALNSYFQTIEVQAAIVEKLKNDPQYVAKLAKLMEAAEGEA